MKFNAKTYLKLLMVVGLIAVVGGTAGTFASFNATTTNGNNTFATGTLVLSNSVDSANACFSTGGNAPTPTVAVDSANENTACDAVFSTTLGQPGDEDGGNVTITNEGSLDPQTLSLSATCTPGANENDTTGFNGSGNICTKLWITVQEWEADGTTARACKVGHTSTTVANTCDWTSPEAMDTLASTPATLASGASALTNGSSRKYTVTVKLDPDADNTFQGRKADVTLSWKAEQ
jgi:predicted ribosomally synthesized peptide with SipW-like signal peptide